jgi:hypothetical protein
MKKFVIALLCFALMMQLADCGNAATNNPAPPTTKASTGQSGKQSVDAQQDEIRQEGGWGQLVKDSDGDRH